MSEGGKPAPVVEVAHGTGDIDDHLLILQERPIAFDDRQPRRGVEIDAAVDHAKERDGSVGRRLARHIAADDAHAPEVLIQSLVPPIGQQRITRRLAQAQIAGADHLIHLLIPRAQLARRSVRGAERGRAPLRVGGSRRQRDEQ